MFNHEDNSNTSTPASRHFDLSMSRRTRKPKIFSEEEELGKEEDDQASLHRSSLMELLTEINGSRRKKEKEILKSEEIKAEAEKEDEIGETLERGDIGEEKRSNLALVMRKGSFVGKYMKVLKRLIKAKGDPVKKRAVIKLPMK